MNIKTNLALLSTLIAFGSCGVSNEEYNNIVKESMHLQQECDSLKSIITSNENTIKNLKDSLVIYSYPADQRFNAILENIKSENFVAAKKEIKALTSIFPKSKEAAECVKQLEIIKKKEERKKAEEERLKALGFKALQQKTTFQVDYNKISISNISIGSQFTFDSYDDSYHYRSADRGNKYVTARMSVTSSSKYPNLPEFALYLIKGDVMEYEGSFDIEYARWRDYGAYLGNYTDYGNDFTKTSTVNFKIGEETSEENTKVAFAIVAKNENVLSEQYERFNNPPKHWTGHANFKNKLKIKDFEKDYTLIKIYNLK